MNNVKTEYELQVIKAAIYWANHLMRFKCDMNVPEQKLFKAVQTLEKQ